MNAVEELKNFKVEIEARLKEYLDQEVEKAAKISPFCKELMEHVSEMTLRGGKRVRSALLYYSYLAHGGQDKEIAMRGAMSMEMVQTYLLIHDDIIDSDDLRRGGATIHKIYDKIGQERYAGKSNLSNFGISAAILAGDMGGTISNELIAGSQADPKLVNRALIELSHMYMEEYYGEFLDVVSELRDDVTKDDVILTHSLKTAPYTFNGPIRIGAILAGASEEQVQKLNDYTVPIGTAFQIHDDILGMFGSEEKLGKPVLSDLTEGKRTLLILDALEKADEKQKQTIEQSLGNKQATLEDLENVKKVIEETGSLDYSKQTTQDLVQKAISALDQLDLKPEGKDFLAGIADYMIKREY